LAQATVPADTVDLGRFQIVEISNAPRARDSRRKQKKTLLATLSSIQCRSNAINKEIKAKSFSKAIR